MKSKIVIFTICQLSYMPYLCWMEDLLILNRVLLSDNLCSTFVSQDLLTLESLGVKYYFHDSLTEQQKMLSSLWSNYRQQISLRIKGVEDFPGGSEVKNLPANAADTGLIPAPGSFTCHGAMKPVCNNCWAHIPQLKPARPGAHAPHQENPLQRGEPMRHSRGVAHSCCN